MGSACVALTRLPDVGRDAPDLRRNLVGGRGSREGVASAFHESVRSRGARHRIACVIRMPKRASVGLSQDESTGVRRTCVSYAGHSFASGAVCVDQFPLHRKPGRYAASSPSSGTQRSSLNSGLATSPDHFAVVDVDRGAQVRGPKGGAGPYLSTARHLGDSAIFFDLQTGDPHRKS